MGHRRYYGCICSAHLWNHEGDSTFCHGYASTNGGNFPPLHYSRSFDLSEEYNPFSSCRQHGEDDRPYYRFGRGADKENLATYSAFTQQISTLAPGTELIFALAPGVVLFGENVDESKTPLTFKVTATYSFSGRKVTETTEVDLRPYQGMHVAYDPIVNELSEIKDVLKKRL
jgi:hypothetical protein